MRKIVKEKAPNYGQMVLDDGAELGVFHVGTERGNLDVVTKKDRESISLAFVYPRRGRTHSYTYHSASGKLERDKETWTGDWVGSIQASRSFEYRIRATANKILEPFGVPTKTAELETFLAGRPPEKKDWYIVQFPEEVGGICLPLLLSYSELTDKSLEESPNKAVISGVSVAPRHQKKGFGTLMHLVLARHLRDEGYKTLLSDMVGMNTEGELAIWARLERMGACVEKCKPMAHFCIPRFLYLSKIISEGMYKILNKVTTTHLSGKLRTAGEVEKIDFPQYEWDLSEPILAVLPNSRGPLLAAKASAA